MIQETTKCRRQRSTSANLLDRRGTSLWIIVISDCMVLGLSNVYQSRWISQTYYRQVVKKLVSVLPEGSWRNLQARKNNDEWCASLILPLFRTFSRSVSLLSVVFFSTVSTSEVLRRRRKKSIIRNTHNSFPPRGDCEAMEFLRRERDGLSLGVKSS